MSYALFLCNRTENMPAPWLEAGIECVTVDMQPADQAHPLRNHIVADIRTWRPNGRPVFIAAFPPCTDLANSGNRWKRDKGLRALIEALELVEACREICAAFRNVPYMIENPTGALRTYWRDPDHSFDPHYYGDPYTKRTHLWTGGGFRMPPIIRPGDLFEAATWVRPSQGSKMHRLPPTADRGDLRSITPPGFARAVFMTNRPVMAEAAE